MCVLKKSNITVCRGHLSSLFCFFCVEAWICRKREISARWLAWSLHITLIGIAGACGLSGGVRSPFLPLMLAPVVIAFAAFGRRAQSASIATVFALLVAALAALPHGWPWGVYSAVIWAFTRPYHFAGESIFFIFSIALGQ